MRPPDRASTSRLERAEEIVRAAFGGSDRCGAPLCGHLAHEIKNRLAGIYAVLQLVGRRLQDDERHKDLLEQAAADALRIDEAANALLALSTPIVLRRRPTDVAELVAGRSPTWRARAECAGHELEVDTPPGLVVEVDRDRIGAVLDALLERALRTMESPGSVRLEARAVAGRLELSVCDRGPRLADEHARALYRPDASRDGLPLLLACLDVEAHGGEIDFPPCAGGGCVRLSLPLGAASAT